MLQGQRRKPRPMWLLALPVGVMLLRGRVQAVWWLMLQWMRTWMRVWMHRWYQVVFGSGQGGLHRGLVVAGVVLEPVRMLRE